MIWVTLNIPSAAKCQGISHCLASVFSPKAIHIVVDCVSCDVFILLHILLCYWSSEYFDPLPQWNVSLWRDSDDVSHCRIVFPDKTEWRLISATLCRWRCCFVADQLWFMTRIWEEERKPEWWKFCTDSKFCCMEARTLWCVWDSEGQTS